jgi:hypothetical protein
LESNRMTSFVGTASSTDGVTREKLYSDYERLRPGPGRSREAVAANQRERIQRAMVELAAEGGRKRITVRQLAKLAGVSSATFYSLFDGVEDCLLRTSGAITNDV